MLNEVRELGILIQALTPNIKNISLWGRTKNELSICRQLGTVEGRLAGFSHTMKSNEMRELTAPHDRYKSEYESVTDETLTLAKDLNENFCGGEKSEDTGYALSQMIRIEEGNQYIKGKTRWIVGRDRYNEKLVFIPK